MGFSISQESMQSIYYIFTIIIVSFLVVLGVSFYYDKSFNIEQLENSLVVSRILLSNDCLANEENFGEIDLNKINEQVISSCTGLRENSLQGLKIEVYGLENNLEKEVEINKKLTSQCLIENIKNIGEKYTCSYSRHYISYNGKNGIMEIMVSNENE